MILHSPPPGTPLFSCGFPACFRPWTAGAHSELETNKSFKHLNMKCMEVLKCCVFWNVWMNSLLFQCCLCLLVCCFHSLFCRTGFFYLALQYTTNDESRPLPTGLVFSSFMTCMSLGSSTTCGVLGARSRWNQTKNNVW